MIPDGGRGHNTPLHVACQHYSNKRDDDKNTGAVVVPSDSSSSFFQKRRGKKINPNNNTRPDDNHDNYLLQLIALQLSESKHPPDANIASFRNDYGQTPLHTACFFKCGVRIIRVLRDAYPPATLMTTADGDTPLDYARRARAPPEVLNVLTEGGEGGGGGVMMIGGAVVVVLPLLQRRRRMMMPVPVTATTAGTDDERQLGGPHAAAPPPPYFRTRL